MERTGGDTLGEEDEEHERVREKEMLLMIIMIIYFRFGFGKREKLMMMKPVRVENSAIRGEQRMMKIINMKIEK